MQDRILQVKIIPTCSIFPCSRYFTVIMSQKYFNVVDSTSEILNLFHQSACRDKLIMNKIVSTFFTLALSLILLGCSFKTNQEPAVGFTLPDTFSQNGQEVLSDKWWQDFNDPTLNTLIDQALGENFSLKAALNRLQQAEASYRVTASDLYPALDGTASADTDRTRASGSTSGSQSYLLGVTASYEVDLWGRIQSLTEAARLDVLGSSMDLETAAITISSQVASTWYQLREQRKRLEVIDQQIITNNKGLQIIRLQFRTGQVGIADILQQQQLIESNTGERAQLIASRDQTFHALNILLGLSPTSTDSIPTGEYVLHLPPLPETGVPAELIQKRPDMQSAFLAVQAADANVAAAIAAQYPTLSISADLNTFGDSTRDLFSDWFSSLAANLVGPIFDAGQRASETDRKRAIAREKLNTYSQTALEALAEVENALIKEEQQRVYITSIDNQLKLAKQSMAQIKNRYIQGMENYQRVLTALVSLQNLQQQYYSARLTLITNRIELCRALAGGWKFSQNNS